MIQPACPNCGEAALYAFGVASEKVEWAITSIDGGFGHKGYLMGPARRDHWEDIDLDEYDEVFCNECGHEMTWDDVYAQAPEVEP